MFEVIKYDFSKEYERSSVIKAHGPMPGLRQPFQNIIHLGQRGLAQGDRFLRLGRCTSEYKTAIMATESHVDADRSGGQRVDGRSGHMTQGTFWIRIFQVDGRW